MQNVRINCSILLTSYKDKFTIQLSMFKNRNRGRKGKNTSMENMYELIAPCHFGLESVLKREILDLGYEIVTVEDGRITFRGDVTAIARANIFIRTAERILLKMGSFRAMDFDELFEGTKAIPWEEFLPRDAKFWVTKATTNKSALFLRVRSSLS